MAASEARDEGEAEVPAAVAESEQREAPPKTQDLPELVVEGRERTSSSATWLPRARRSCAT